MNEVYNPKFINQADQIRNCIANFDETGELFIAGKRNRIKTFSLDGITMNVKRFKVPNLINKIVYRFFRKSKAERSYEFAKRLTELEIGTPKPIGYFENKSFLFFKESYYCSEHFLTDLTFRELTTDFNYPEWEEILRQFAQFTFDLHQKGVEFLDHSPGNTLINKCEDGKYNFYLVDLNRMEFHQDMPFDSRMRNFSRLTNHKEIIEILSDEYSKLYTAKSKSEIFEKMWQETLEFRSKFDRKKRLKKKMKI